MDEGGVPGGSGVINPYSPPAASLDTGTAAAEAGFFKSLTPLAQAITVVLGLLVLIEALNVAHSLSSIGVMQKVMAGTEPVDDEVQAIDQRALMIGGAEILLALTTVVLFCFFMPRANRNLRVFHPGEAAIWLAFKPRQTVAAFFIPIVNLYKPYRAMKEIWQWSDPSGDPALSPAAVKVPALLPWWWAFYLIDNFASQVSSRAGSNASSPSAFISKAWTEMGASVISAVSAVLAIAVVRAVARRQEQRQARRAQSAP